MNSWEDLFATRSERMKASEIRELLKLLDQPDIISFAGGIPDPELFPKEEFSRAYAEVLGSELGTNALQYSVTEGYPPLREWICGYMAEAGVACSPDNVLITSGSQQGLDYLGKLFLSPADTALVEWPTYLGALQAFNAYEPNFDRLDLQTNREPADFRDRAAGKGGAVKFAYACTDFANPTGNTMDAVSREKLLDLAERLDIAIIEDAAYHALRYDGDPLDPVLARDIARNGDIEKTRTVFCGTFSKTLTPGLRVGWMVAASEIISKLVLIKQASDLHSPSINQMVVDHVARVCFDEQVEKIRKVYRERRDRMLAQLDLHMPDGVSWSHPNGGMFIWVTLPEQIDGAALLAKSIETTKVAFVPGSAFYADGSVHNTIRLSFSCATPQMIDTGIERLGSLVKQAAS